MATMKTLNGYGFNATELNGKTSDNYLLITDTAPDSSKLGGKAPEYYIQPRNLLDNSDFSNPINQRGISGDYQYFSNAYTIDRWKLDNRTGGQAGIKLSEIGVVISNSSNYSEFTQYVIADTGKQYTLAVGTGDGVKILSGVPSANPESQFLKMKLSTQGYVKCYIIIPSSEITLHWAALYEGSYTADTLPPYVPKGYAAELAECQRYFLHDVGKFNPVIFTNTSVAITSINTPSTMRIVPTVQMLTTDNIVMNISGAGKIVAVSGASVNMMNGNSVVVNISCNAENIPIYAPGSTFLTAFNLSADL